MIKASTWRLLPLPFLFWLGNIWVGDAVYVFGHTCTYNHIQSHTCICFHIGFVWRSTIPAF
jgi:hypothetical protein